MFGVVAPGWITVGPISTEDGNGVRINAYVIYGSLQSDHIPIVFELDLQLVPDVDYCADNTARRID